MRSIIVKLIVVFVFFISQMLFSQDFSQIKNINVDDLTDEKIVQFWDKTKEKGYSWSRVEALLRSKGMRTVEIDKLRRRIREIELKKFKKEKIGQPKDSITDDDIILFGLTGEELDEDLDVKKDSLFGFDFFKNTKISFTPNINVATPKNYQVGSSDVLQIEIWGAAEASYNEKVNKQGFIKIDGVGLINVGGLSLEMVTSKVKSKLSRVYSGINAPRNSYNKVYVNVSLSNIRTVQVNIVGEVKVPGTYSLSALSTVLNALYAAGGPTKNGTFRKISLIRNGERISEFDIYQYLLNGSEKGNKQVKDQDVIIVEPYRNLITITGQVKRPGFYELKKGQTIKDLLQYCGGFTAQAYKESVVVERVNSVEREIKEFKFKEVSDAVLQDGDEINIKRVVDIFKNRVKIEGAINQPGSYEFTKGMTVSNLLEKASGVSKEAFLSRASITRYFNEVEKEIISFSISDLSNSKNNILLQANDEVYIYRKDELVEKRFVTINGAVNKPQKIDYAIGMTVEDAIALSNGLKEGADPSNVQVSRRLKDGSFETVGRVYKINSNEGLISNKDNKKQFTLEPYDVLSVRYLQGYTEQKNVFVKGEIKYPGEYSITTKNERISDLIKRAGGLSPYAYIEGATLTRKKVGVVEDEQEKLLKEIKKEANVDDDFEEGNNQKSKKESEQSSRDEELFGKSVDKKKSYRIGINLKEILEKKGSSEDLILQEGDELLIPSEKQTVEVQGEVYSPSLVRYIPGKSLNYYIDRAGGVTQDAKKKKSYVVYSNGDVDATTSFLFFKSYPKVKPGATILVPKKDRNRKVSAQEIIGITTGIATLGVLIDRLIK